MPTGALEVSHPLGGIEDDEARRVDADACLGDPVLGHPVLAQGGSPKARRFVARAEEVCSGTRASS